MNVILCHRSEEEDVCHWQTACNICVQYRMHVSIANRPKGPQKTVFLIMMRTAIYLPCFSPHRVCISIDQCLTLRSVCRCIPVCTTVILIGAVYVCVCVCACVCSGLVCFHVDFETFFFVYIFPYLLCTCVCLFCPEQYGGILYGLDLEAVEQ